MMYLIYQLMTHLDLIHNLCNLCLSVGLSLPNRIGLVIFLTHTVWEITRDDLLARQDLAAARTKLQYWLRLLRIIDASNFGRIMQLATTLVGAVFFFSVCCHCTGGRPRLAIGPAIRCPCHQACVPAEHLERQICE